MPPCSFFPLPLRITQTISCFPSFPYSPVFLFCSDFDICFPLFSLTWAFFPSLAAVNPSSRQGACPLFTVWQEQARPSRLNDLRFFLAKLIPSCGLLKGSNKRILHSLFSAIYIGINLSLCFASMTSDSFLQSAKLIPSCSLLKGSNKRILHSLFSTI